jgi:hypothetical protein
VPGPVAVTPDSSYANVIFLAENAMYARGAPAHYKMAFSADPAYDDQATRQNAHDFQDMGHGIYVWFVPTEVSMQRAREVAYRIGATQIIGQAETLAQFWASWYCGVRAVVGNLDAIMGDPDAIELVRSGRMAFINECYWNTNRGLNTTFTNYNLPVPSICIGLYDAGPAGENKPNGWDPTVADYHDAGLLPPSVSVYGPGTSPRNVTRSEAG